VVFTWVSDRFFEFLTSTTIPGKGVPPFASLVLTMRVPVSDAWARPVAPSTKTSAIVMRAERRDFTISTSDHSSGVRVRKRLGWLFNCPSQDENNAPTALNLP
jgi:hypothetical protein